MKNKILVSAPIDFIPGMEEDIQEIFDAEINKVIEKKDLLSLPNLSEIEGWLINPCPRYIVDNEILSKMENLKIIATPSTGSNHIDMNLCQSLGIKVYTLKDTEIVSSITASSEFTFALMLSMIRRIPQATKISLYGDWRKDEELLRGREFPSLKLGIIGLGRIGMNLSNYSFALGMQVSFYDPYVSYDSVKIKRYESLSSLLKNSDIVVSCVHLNTETFHMMNEDTFSIMKDGAYFINTSRGDVVDERALISALNSGKISACALDVISGENSENIYESEILDYAKHNENLIITPHIAGLTIDSERKAQLGALTSLIDYFKTE